MQYTTDGLVIREIKAGENDRLLTILTPMSGRISVMAKGARSMKSKVSTITQPYVYANFEIYSKGDCSWLRGGSLYEPFYRLRNELCRLALAAYLSDVAYDVTGEGVPCVDILRMTLNSFHALTKTDKPPALIKGVYEIRAAGYSGYMPDIDGCYVCGKENAPLSYLDVMNGRIICDECKKKQDGTLSVKHISREFEYTDETTILCPMNAHVASAIRFALTAMPERMFAFTLNDESDLADFGRICETYLLNHLERGFNSLDFYKSVL